MRQPRDAELKTAECIVDAVIKDYYVGNISFLSLKRQFDDFLSANVRILAEINDLTVYPFIFSLFGEDGRNGGVISSSQPPHRGATEHKYPNRRACAPRHRDINGFPQTVGPNIDVLPTAGCPAPVN